MVLTEPYSSPCGDLVLGSFGEALCLCNWVEEKHPLRVNHRLRTLLDADMRVGGSDITREAARQLDEYFQGRRRVFDIPLRFAGTAFQETVWRGLLEIPYGHTVSYGELAERLGMNSNTLKYHIKRMREKGILERSGSRRKGQWLVKK